MSEDRRGRAGSSGTERTDGPAVGVRAVGAYAPGYRLPASELEAAWDRTPSGIETTAVPAADEDALTMAYEAASRALDAAGLEGSQVGFLAFASTTPPLAEADVSVRLGSFLGVPERATRHVFTGNTRAGTRALVAGIEHLGGRGRTDPAGSEANVDGSTADRTRGGVALVVASDCPRGAPDSTVEHAAGAGAAALVLDTERSVGTGRPSLATVAARGEYASAVPGTRFRPTGSEVVRGIGVTPYDRQTFAETVRGALAGFDRSIDDADAIAMTAPDGALPYRAAGALGLDRERIEACSTVETLGDTGAASALLSLARALAAGHDRVLVLGYGSGAGADALSIRSDGGSVPTSIDLNPGEEITYDEYLRLRGELAGDPPEGGGAYVSVPSWRRTIPQRHRLVAGRCPECGALSFPPEGACSDCLNLVEYERLELPRIATVEAVTSISQGGAPPEFAERQSRGGDFVVVIVAFAVDGRTVSLPAQVADRGRGAERVTIGDRVTTTIRHLYTQEGVTRYAVKVRATDPDPDPDSDERD